jgi:excisionase family DNA binding protein
MTAVPTRIPRLLSVKQAADIVGVSTRTIRRWIDAKELPFHRLGRQIRIAEDDLTAFLAKNRQG